MLGQWLGVIQGSTNGFVVLNIDKDSSYGSLSIVEEVDQKIFGLVADVHKHLS